MKQTIKILGLGIERFSWRRLCSRLQQEFSMDQIDLEFFHIKYKLSAFKEKSLDLMHELKPDIIFSTLTAFKGFEDFEQFLQSYDPSEVIDYPGVFLIERKPTLFFKEYLAAIPMADFEFRQLPNLRIESPDYFADIQNDVPSLFQIKPAPVLKTVSVSLRPLNAKQTIYFAAWDNLKTVYWENHEYTSGEFNRLMKDRFKEKKQEFKKIKGILLRGDNAYLSSGFHVCDLINIKTNSLPIEHIITYDQVKKGGRNYRAFLLKLTEQCKYRCSIRFHEEMLKSTNNIKANIPLTIISENPLFSKVFYHLFQKYGYFQALTTDHIADPTNRLLINLAFEAEKETPLCHTIQLDKHVFDIFGFAELSQDDFDQPTIPEDIQDSVKIQRRRKQIFNQIKKLQDQLKVLSSSKALDDQKRYLDMISRGKLEIITNLFEIAEIWSEQNCDVAVSNDENVLVFYDDEQQASSINRFLEGNNRRVFLDLSKETISLEALVRLNTDRLEPFLHDGVVITPSSTKVKIIKRFQAFHNELAQRTYPPLAEGIEQLKSELKQCQQQIKKLSILETWCEFEKIFQKNEQAIFQAAQNSLRIIENKQMSTRRIKNICIISSNQEKCRQVEKAFTRSFPIFKDAEFYHVWSYLKLDINISTQAYEQIKIKNLPGEDLKLMLEKKLAQTNAQRVSVFINELLDQLKGKPFDLLIVENDLDVIQLIVDFLKENHSIFNHTPVIGVFSGAYNLDKMIELTHNSVKLVYQNQFKIQKKDTLVESFKTVLSII